MATETKSKNESKGFFTSIRDYLSNVRGELRKVTWPTREDVIHLTRVVLLVTAITSVFLGALSALLTIGLDQFGLSNPWILVVVFVAISVGTWWAFRQDGEKRY